MRVIIQLSLFLAHINVITSFLPQVTPSHTLSLLSSTSTSTSLNVFDQKQSNSNTATAIRPDGNDNENNVALPFIVQELSQNQARVASDAISDLVIKVFFEEEAELRAENRSKRGMTPWKVMQLAYLKNLQNGDVKAKKFMLNRNINNSMFAAFQIVPSYGSKIKPIDEIDVENNNGDDNTDVIYNKECLPDDTDTFKLGPLLGFVDVSEKTFGLASDNKVIVEYDEEEVEGDGEKSKSPPMNEKTLRPVLTNLSVQEEARRSGVGSALVDACEQVVMTEWSTTYNEMVLEVEEENELAQKFYEKRGYVKLYSDPSARRFDTSGIILKDVRTTKICYRKEIQLKSNLFDSVGGSGGGFFDIPFFAKFKNAISGKN